MKVQSNARGMIGFIVGAAMLVLALRVGAHDDARDWPDTTEAPVASSLNNFDSYLFDWQRSGRAHVVGLAGSGDGTVAAGGARRVVTLDSPISVLADAFGPDACGDYPQMRQDTLQVAVNRLGGSVRRGASTVAVAGTQTALTGCEAGKVVPIGLLDATVLTARHLALRERPEVDDLRPGVALAGPSEQAWGDDSTAGVLTLQTGGLGLFAGSGSVVGAGFNAQRWLLIQQATGTRARTRLSEDPQGGTEVWLDALWSAGQPARVRSMLIAKPQAWASFGSLVQASRVWESGIFLGSRSPVYLSLFQDGTVDRVLADPDNGTQLRAPITPVSVNLGGGVSVRFLPRVNCVVDRGAATL